MKDERGVYYYPSLQNRRTRMYVRERGEKIEFRLWSQDDPDIWERHEWIPREVVEKAAEKYKERDDKRNPLGLYDLDVAKAVIQEEKAKATH